MHPILAQATTDDLVTRLDTLIDLIQTLASPAGFGWGFGTALTFWGGMLVWRLIVDAVHDADES